MQLLRHTVLTLCALMFFGAVHCVHGAVLININTADAATLATLEGVGEVKVQAIIDYRKTNGPFSRIEDIMNVSGIGQATFDKNRHRITVGTKDTEPENKEPDPQKDDPPIEEVEDDTSDDTESDGTPRRQSFSSGTELTAALTAPERAYVHQPVSFAIIPRGLSASKLMTMHYTWNFGDGATSDRRTPTHTYTAPGTYRVVARAMRDGHEVVVRAKVTVLPLAVSLGRTRDGELLLHSDAQYEMNISGVQLSDGEHIYTIPEDTYLLPRATITLPSLVTGFSSTNSAYLFAQDTRGELLAEYPDPEVHQVQQRAPVVAALSLPRQAAPAPAVSESAEKENVVTEETHATTTTVMSQPRQQLVAAAVHADEDGMLPSTPRDAAPYAFAGILIIGILALYAHKLV